MATFILTLGTSLDGKTQNKTAHILKVNTITIHHTNIR
jgi:hypothetical protein